MLSELSGRPRVALALELVPLALELVPLGLERASLEPEQASLGLEQASLGLERALPVSQHRAECLAHRESVRLRVPAPVGARGAGCRRFCGHWDS